MATETWQSFENQANQAAQQSYWDSLVAGQEEARREFQRRRRQAVSDVKTGAKRAVSKVLTDDSDEGALDQFKDQLQRKSKQKLKAQRKVVRKAAQRKVTQKIATKLATRATLRTVAVACGSTGIGLIVTYIIWTIQAIGGNLMGSKWIPELEWWELILWAILGVLILIALSIVLLFNIITIAVTNPVIGITILGAAIISQF